MDLFGYDSIRYSLEFAPASAWIFFSSRTYPVFGPSGNPSVATLETHTTATL